VLAGVAALVVATGLYGPVQLGDASLRAGKTGDRICIVLRYHGSASSCGSWRGTYGLPPRSTISLVAANRGFRPVAAGAAGRSVRAVWAVRTGGMTPARLVNHAFLAMLPRGSALLGLRLRYDDGTTRTRLFRRGYAVDLESGRIDGHDILGATIHEVVVALGKPDFRVAGSRSRIGWGRRDDFAAEVLFSHGRATSIVFERGLFLERRIGDLLRRSPALEQKIANRYGDTFSLLHPYACGDALCVGEFVQRAGPLHVTFGTHGRLGTWVTLWRTMGAK
jgi:hypothetical protein